ncbi:MAG: hypothetical protein AB7F65_11000 [Dehalococcoidia bacterium]
MATRPDPVLPAILGVMAAGRSQSVPALIAWGQLDRRAGSNVGRGVATCLVASEVVGDKLPWIPDRTEAGPLAGRVAFGAAGGAAVERFEGGPGWRGALIGGAAAAAGTFAIHRVRRWLSEHTPLPPIAWGIAEDAGVAALGIAAARRLRVY